jgi:hypothetical protein
MFSNIVNKNIKLQYNVNNRTNLIVQLRIIKGYFSLFNPKYKGSLKAIQNM